MRGLIRPEDIKAKPADDDTSPQDDTGQPLALLSKFGPVVLMDFGPPPVPQPTVARVYREAWRGLESQSGFVRAAASGA